ncbi:hypothetical protein [Roseovarius sp. MBR-6]|jgi:hypothetical protein|uniref:hypothetical protein n=1 Tax=Roseovarius sp. MBR-6 TaxID=3156459 RepID=UPI0033936C13
MKAALSFIEMAHLETAQGLVFAFLRSRSVSAQARPRVALGRRIGLCRRWAATDTSEIRRMLVGREMMAAMA